MPPIIPWAWRDARRLHRWAVVTGLACTPVATLRSQGVTPVLVSASGGIAKGSYQAGVDWTINEFLRRQRNPAWRGRIAPNLPEYALGSATGASAGNVNALLAAIGWCTDSVTLGKIAVTRIPAESSLFWSSWVNTGSAEILPGDAAGKSEREPAVLDRRYFLDVRRKEVGNFLGRAYARPGCSVPLGVTLTRIAPLVVQVEEEGVSASVQRFATVLRVVASDSAGIQRIDVVAPPPEVQRARSLGALALLPALESRATSSRSNRIDALFEAVIASSSFPIAFAPRCLTYARGGLALGRDSLPVESPTCELFNDGGTFDNNPFGLAQRLYELDALRSTQADGARGVVVAYTNPGLLRGKLRSERSVEATSERRSGIGALVQMIGGTWTSAHEYELQSLLRQQERDREMGRGGSTLPLAAVPDVRRSTRSSPIFGEFLSSFAGFLGRPLREYDFYSGVYDGLRFVAEHFVCQERPTTVGPAPRASATCTDSVHAQLVRKDVFEMSRTAREVLGWQLALEHGGAPDTVDLRAYPDSTDLEVKHLAMLARLHNAMRPLRHRPPSAKCGRRADPWTTLLCKEQLDVVFRTLGGGDGRFLKIAGEFCERCRADSVARHEGRCVVDERFLDLITDAPRAIDALARMALRNLQDAEDKVQESGTGQRDYGAWTELALMTYLGRNYRYRHGFEVNPSSAAWDFSRTSRKFGSVLGKVLPYSVSVGGRGVARGDPPPQTFSKTQPSPTTWTWHPLALHGVGPTTVSWVAEGTRYAQWRAHGTRWDKERRYTLAQGLSLSSHALVPPGLTSIEAGVVWSRHLLRHSADEGARLPVYSLAGRLFEDKVQLTWRWSPQRGWVAQAGVADLNGLVYWWLR